MRDVHTFEIQALVGAHGPLVLRDAGELTTQTMHLILIGKTLIIPQIIIAVLLLLSVGFEQIEVESEGAIPRLAPGIDMASLGQSESMMLSAGQLHHYVRLVDRRRQSDLYRRKVLVEFAVAIFGLDQHVLLLARAEAIKAGQRMSDGVLVLLLVVASLYFDANLPCLVAADHPYLAFLGQYGCVLLAAGNLRYRHVKRGFDRRVVLLWVEVLLEVVSINSLRLVFIHFREAELTKVVPAPEIDVCLIPFLRFQILLEDLLREAKSIFIFFAAAFALQLVLDNLLRVQSIHQGILVAEEGAALGCVAVLLRVVQDVRR